MKKLILGIILGLLISNIFGAFLDWRFATWRRSHGKNIGMPWETVEEVAQWIRHPINQICMCSLVD